MVIMLDILNCCLKFPIIKIVFPTDDKSRYVARVINQRVTSRSYDLVLFYTRDFVPSCLNISFCRIQNIKRTSYVNSID